MANYPKQLKLRSGEEIVLRPAQPDDVEALTKFFAATTEEDRLFLKDDVTDPAVIQGWLDNIDLDHVFPLLAFHGDVVIGDGTLHRPMFGWSQHVGELRVVVDRGWQRKGVGQSIVRELVARAIDVGIELLEANLLEGQVAAVAAFERIGFEVETVLKGRAKDRTGRQRDVLVLTRDTSELWRRMEDLITDQEFAPRGY